MKLKDFLINWIEKKEKERFEYKKEQHIMAINSGSLHIEGNRSFRIKLVKPIFGKQKWVKVYE